MRRLAKAPSAGSTLPSGNTLRGIQIVALALALTFAFGASQALAVDYTYSPVGTFASGPGAGAGELDAPRRSAVNQATGDLYVADSGNDRIVVFRPGSTPAGTYLTQFGSAVLDEPFGVAVDSDSGDVYVSSAGSDEIVKFNSDGAPTPSFSPDASFTSPSLGAGAAQIGDFEADLAVDPTSGDLLVADPASDLVKRFDDSGAHLANFDGASSPSGAFVGLLDIDVAPDGDVYAVDATGPLYVEAGVDGCEGNAWCNRNTSRVVRFDPDGGNGEDVVPSAPEALGVIAIDPTSGQLLAGVVNPQLKRIFAYRADGSAQVSQFEFGMATLNSIAAGGPLSRVYLVEESATNPSTADVYGETVVRADRAVPYPELSAVGVSDVTGASAHVSGTVNPNGEPTEARVEYTRDGNWQVLEAEEIGGGTSPVPVEADLEGLVPGVEYTVRLWASNSAGATANSPEATFTTASVAPSVLTLGAAPRTQTSARINGWINPNNSPTTYHFEFGPTASYGAELPAPPESAGAGEMPIAVSAQLDGLAPGTTYHYRLVAENATGETVGPDQTFTTRVPGEAGPPARGVELVNNPDKGNQPANIEIFSPIASPDASKIIWSTTAGAPGGPSGSGGSFMAERTPTGWRSRSMLPPVDQLVDNGSSRYIPRLATPNFDRFVYEVSSGILLTPPYKLVTMDLAYNQRLMGGEIPEPDLFTRFRANDDLSHVYANTTYPGEAEQIYDFTVDPPQLVSVMPNGTPADCGTGLPSGNAEWGGYGPYEWVSTDPAAPARVFFESAGEAPCKPGILEKLFMRDLDSETTTLISGPALPGGNQEELGVFARASDDGSEVVFSALSRLTPDDTNDVGDLYRAKLGVGKECLTCVGPGADVVVHSSHQRSVVVSNDLSYVYFVSNRMLVPGAGTVGANNLYVWHDGEVEYVAPLGSFAFEDVEVEMAAGGRVLFFLSDDPEVTTDDNGGQAQIYRYSDVDRSIECVSCADGVGAGRVGETGLGQGQWGLTKAALGGDAYVFTSRRALDPSDINGDTDIYEWRNGQLSLVTDGVTQYPDGTGRLVLRGIGNDGLNVVFTAGPNFTGFERDRVGQLYVARAGGGFPPPPAEEAPCGEESCQGPLRQQPASLAPASAGYGGAGNVAEPAQSPRKRCVKPRNKRKKASASANCVKKKTKKKRTHNKKQGGKR